MIITYKDSPPCPCRVYDANGLEWKYLRSVDTETGEAEQCVTDENGIKQLAPCRTEIATRTVRLATPIVIVPMTRPGYDRSESLYGDGE